ncbi:hypothetical protein LAZ67_2001411 [Cordylochernes scorpioides]|uniref:Uncharacterized protein n=1 Tax=Cordylochernes scorpioides TaxID=51811 RepID=A0ABY6K1Z3_9ARAC|nr:hypothetical protein LAZ67_2001411 [Cordylochernes scorpioides]
MESKPPMYCQYWSERKAAYVLPILVLSERKADYVLPILVLSERKADYVLPILVLSERKADYVLPILVLSERKADYVLPILVLSERKADYVLPILVLSERKVDYVLPILVLSERKVDYVLPILVLSERKADYVLPIMVLSERKVDYVLPILVLSERKVDYVLPILVLSERKEKIRGPPWEKLVSTPPRCELSPDYQIQAMIIMQFDFALTNVPESRLVSKLFSLRAIKNPSAKCLHEFMDVCNEPIRNLETLELKRNQLVDVILVHFLQQKLSENLRTYPVAITADIERMYRQIRIHPEDVDYRLLTWRLASILEVYPGSDQKVRVAQVRAATGVYLRPITKLAPLPFKSEPGFSGRGEYLRLPTSPDCLCGEKIKDQRKLDKNEQVDVVVGIVHLKTKRVLVDGSLRCLGMETDVLQIQGHVTGGEHIPEQRATPVDQRSERERVQVQVVSNMNGFFGTVNDLAKIISKENFKQPLLLYFMFWKKYDFDEVEDGKLISLENRGDSFFVRTGVGEVRLISPLGNIIPRCAAAHRTWCLRHLRKLQTMGLPIWIENIIDVIVNGRQFKQTDAFTRGMVIGLKRAAPTVEKMHVVDRRILRQAVAAPQATCTAILQHVQDTLDHSISTRTISRRLVANGLHSCRPLRRLSLTPPNRRQRFEWRRARSTWMTEWHRVVFSDESRFCLSSDSRRVRVWRRRGKRSNPAAIVERPTVRQRGIMVWGAIAYDSRSPLLRIQGTMTAQRYVDDVLRPVTLPYLQGVPNALYQQDNARPHTARISQQALQDVQMLPWPPYSPDISPIEHVWDIIGRRLHALPQPRSEDELWQMGEGEKSEHTSLRSPWTLVIFDQILNCQMQQLSWCGTNTYPHILMPAALQKIDIDPEQLLYTPKIVDNAAAAVIEMHGDI